MRTQNQMVLDRLKAGERLNPMTALAGLNIMRLAARINDLRNEGNEIATLWRDLPSGKRVAEYKLIKLAGMHA